jgi:hypothetical protein
MYKIQSYNQLITRQNKLEFCARCYASAVIKDSIKVKDLVNLLKRRIIGSLLNSHPNRLYIDSLHSISAGFMSLQPLRSREKALINCIILVNVVNFLGKYYYLSCN